MLLKEATFRNLLYTMIIVKSKKDAEYQEKLFKIDSIDLNNFEEEFGNIQIENNVNAMLLFPYLDYTQGLSFLLVANGLIEGNTITFYERPNFDTFQIIRKDTLNDKEIFYLKDLLVNNDFDLEHYVNYAINQTEVYRKDSDVEILRAFSEIDPCRNEDFPDDFLVFFFKEGLNPEGMWVRGMELKKDHILAELLNQPNQDFGVNAGDIIKVVVYEDESGEISCIADLR
ncbi:MAG: hypothetical protein IJ104_11435 [Methanobrevibacter sp.]|nr:hypothetical protein [Methanobrevibacter sp.]